MFSFRGSLEFDFLILLHQTKFCIVADYSLQNPNSNPTTHSLLLQRACCNQAEQTKDSKRQRKEKCHLKAEFTEVFLPGRSHKNHACAQCSPRLVLFLFFYRSPRVVSWVTCVGHLPIAMIKHQDQMQLEEERVYFDLRFSRDRVSNGGRKQQKKRAGWSHFSPQEAEKKKKPDPSGTLPLAKLHLLKLPQPSQIAPSTRDQVFKYRSLLGIFLFLSTALSHGFFSIYKTVVFSSSEQSKSSAVASWGLDLSWPLRGPGNSSSHSHMFIWIV